MKVKKNRGGFTLTELLVTVTVIGILAAIAIPAYTGYQSRAKKAEAKTNVQALYLLLKEYFADNGSYIGPGGQMLVDYREDDAGTILSETIRDDGTGPYLAGFAPKSAAARQGVLYDYQIQLFAANPQNFLITARPVQDGRGAPDHAGLVMDQDGTKTCEGGGQGCW